MFASSPLAKRRAVLGDVPLHVAEEAGHVGGAHAAGDPRAAAPERLHAREAREPHEAAPADAPVDGVGGGVVRDGDHPRQRRARRRIERAVPAQVGDQQHRLDDARRDERARGVVAVHVTAAVDHGDGDAPVAPGRPRERGAPGAGGGHERGEGREDAERGSGRARLRAAARVHGVRDEQVAAASHREAAAPGEFDPDGRDAAGHQAPDDVAGARGDQQVDGHLAAGRVVGAIPDAGGRAAVDGHGAHHGGRQGVADAGR